MEQLWQEFWIDESGQGLIEYSLIGALVAVGLMLALGALRDGIGGVFDAITGELNDAPADQYQPAGSGDGTG